MDHGLGQTGETTQTRRPVLVAKQLGDAEAGQLGVMAADQRIYPPVLQQFRQDAAQHIAAADNQESLHSEIIP